ncbi:hypothetical protein SAMN04488063_0623 [Halopelagius inordinatus]|uniref:DUF4239 domain-containing protein n=1 Tax=Halopelagius inordinatus TaxID=553467 RepID=A0A1I2M859_9EURY|nr:hypothetical protein [Halopelagius inordinatus]SFF87693.1 hypothetical protein SAMN04488063_0623 [Halopelagius inordinatus]
MGSFESTESGDPDGDELSGPIGRAIEWVKVGGDRLLLTVGISALIFAFLLVLHALGVVEFKNANSVTRLASGMIAGSFSLVTLVVSVNQLILSQEFTPAGEHRDQFEGVMQFRRDIEDRSHVPTAPVEPARMMTVIAEAIVSQAETLADAVSDHPDEEFERRVTEYTERLAERTERFDERLDPSKVDAFDALSAAVTYNDGWQISAVRSLRNGAPELTAETEREFDELVDRLRLFSTAQEHFKTVYLQRELTRFSQLTIYCGVPAVVSAALIILVHGDIGGATIEIGYVPYVTSFLVTVVLVPLVLLSVYILRTATITRQTSTTGPLLLEEPTRERPGDVTANDADR